MCQGGATDCNDFEIVQVGDTLTASIDGNSGSTRVRAPSNSADSARHGPLAPNEGILINSGWETAFAATSQGRLLRPSHSTVDFSDYFTPRMGGLQFAISWTPDTQTDVGTGIGGGGGEEGDRGGVRFGTADKNTTYTNAIDLGIHYSGEFDGVGVTAQAGLGTVDAPDNLGGDDPEIYQAGVAVSFENFTVAAGWAEVNDGMQLSGGQSTEGESWTVGAGYSTGPWAVSAGYFHGEEEGSILNSGDDENDFFQVSTSYALSPGLGVNLQYLHIEREADVDMGPGSGSTDSDTDAVMLGVKVAF